MKMRIIKLEDLEKPEELNCSKLVDAILMYTENPKTIDILEIGENEERGKIFVKKSDSYRTFLDKYWEIAGIILIDRGYTGSTAQEKPSGIEYTIRREKDFFIENFRIYLINHLIKLIKKRINPKEPYTLLDLDLNDE